MIWAKERWRHLILCCLLGGPLLALQTGCASTSDGDGDLHDEDLHQDVHWEDLLGDANANYVPSPVAPPLELKLTPEHLAQVPAVLRGQPALARLALSRVLASPAPYAGGVFGLAGSAKVFVAPLTSIKDSTRLYWVMVQVLSEKFGCFMTAKQNLVGASLAPAVAGGAPKATTWGRPGGDTLVKCRDGRQVMFWEQHGPDWIQFHARQYDAQGYEIAVLKHRIVRISAARELTGGAM